LFGTLGSKLWERKSETSDGLEMWVRRVLLPGFQTWFIKIWKMAGEVVYFIV